MDHQQQQQLILGIGLQQGELGALGAMLAQLELRFEAVEVATDLAPLSEAASGRSHEPSENIFGRAGALLDLLSRRQPAAVLMAAHNPDIPWQQWLPMLKRSPASRRIPVFMVADVWDDREVERADQLGAEGAVTPAKVSAATAEQLRQAARQPDLVAIQTACDEPLDPRAREGIDAYNAGHYYDAHEYLEEAWKADTGPGRDLYRAILQIGVALYQVQRGNYNGAVKMLLRVRQWLQPLPATCRGVDVAALQDDALSYYDAIIALGPARLAEFDWRRVRPVSLKDAP
ncbi:MAG: DUF309 domain-containing protein [Anaerolineales bacterium]|nr:DUF309 domain-containing protein [Anaerolineales bacterium]